MIKYLHVYIRSTFACGAVSKGSFPPFRIIPSAHLENSQEWTELREQTEGGEKVSFGFVRLSTKCTAAPTGSDDEGD